MILGGITIMTIYGYCRISTARQNIERQERNIREYDNTAVILKEAYTGTDMERPIFTKLLKTVRKGDTIIFDSVSRMSGDEEEGFNAYEELYKMGINLVFLNEPHINTETYKKALANPLQMTGSSVDYILEGINKYLLEIAKEQIRLAFAQSEKEVRDLHIRTKQGVATARLNGRVGGIEKGRKLTTKKSIEAKDIIQKHSKSFNGTLTDEEVMKLAGISRNTYYKYKRELQETT